MGTGENVTTKGQTMKPKQRVKKPDKNLVYGRRAVQELLESNCEIIEVHLASTDVGSEPIRTIVRLAEAKSIKINRIDKYKLDSITADGNHQGIAAYFRQDNILSVERIIKSNNGEKNVMLLLLDGVQDPHNFGAIIRSAEVLGAGGVVFRQRRAVGVTPAAIKSSAGAGLRIPLAVTENINQTIKLLKQHGYWIYGLDAGGDGDLYETDLAGKVGLVLGSEGDGISQLTKKRCDGLIRIPQVGKIGSLNVSVSAGIAISYWLRRYKQPK